MANHKVKYISIREMDNDEAPNAGTLEVMLGYSNEADKKFKEAIESHFDAELVSYEFGHADVTSLFDCINAVPIDVKVIVDIGYSKEEYIVELSETWLY